MDHTAHAYDDDGDDDYQLVLLFFVSACCYGFASAKSRASIRSHMLLVFQLKLSTYLS